MIIGKVPPRFEEYVKGRDSQFPKVNIITLIIIMGVTCNENMLQVEVFDKGKKITMNIRLDLWTLRNKTNKASLFECCKK